MDDSNKALKGDKRYKVERVIIIIALLFFPLKWFLFTPIYNIYLSSEIQQIDKDEFFNIANQIKGCKAGDDVYGLINCDNQYDTVNAKTGVTFSTKNSQYYFIEEGAEPVWKSCIYKVNGSNKQLLPLPGNCHYWTWFQVGASTDSENLIVSQLGWGTYQYVVNDDGKIYSYLKPNAVN